MPEGSRVFKPLPLLHNQHRGQLSASGTQNLHQVFYAGEWSDAFMRFLHEYPFFMGQAT